MLGRLYIWFINDPACMELHWLLPIRMKILFTYSCLFLTLLPIPLYFIPCTFIHQVDLIVVSRNLHYRNDRRLRFVNCRRQGTLR